LRRLRQKTRGFFKVFEETTTTVESKYLNQAKLRYTNTKLCLWRWKKDRVWRGQGLERRRRRRMGRRRMV